MSLSVLLYLFFSVLFYFIFKSLYFQLNVKSLFFCMFYLFISLFFFCYLDFCFSTKKKNITDSSQENETMYIDITNNIWWHLFFHSSVVLFFFCTVFFSIDIESTTVSTPIMCIVEIFFLFPWMFFIWNSREKFKCNLFFFIWSQFNTFSVNIYFILCWIFQYHVFVCIIMNF